MWYIFCRCANMYFHIYIFLTNWVHIYINILYFMYFQVLYFIYWMYKFYTISKVAYIA